MKMLTISILLLALASSLAAQDTSTAKGCVATAQDRTIQLCDPPGTTLPLRVQIRAYAASTSSVTSFQLWMDGVKKFETAGQSCSACDRATMTPVVQPSTEGWHRFVFIAKDAVGEFRKTAYYFLTSRQACVASQDREIKSCNGLKDGDVVTSPIHVLLATRESNIPLFYLQILPDSQSDFIPLNVMSLAPNTTTHQLGLSGYVHLKPGVHRLRFNANAQGDLTWDKEITITVVE